MLQLRCKQPAVFIDSTVVSDVMSCIHPGATDLQTPSWLFIELNPSGTNETKKTKKCHNSVSTVEFHRISKFQANFKARCILVDIWSEGTAPPFFFFGKMKT